MARRYQTHGWKDVSPIPLLALSKQNGAVMLLSNFFAPPPQSSSRPRLRSSKANSHRPFRFIHCSRWNWGCGYSGRGTSSAARSETQENTRTADIDIIVFLPCPLQDPSYHG